MSNLITLQIEGTPSDGGHVLVGDFIGRIENLLLALNGIDRIVGQSGSLSLDYRIVDAKHRSPLSFTLEPVLKKKLVPARPDHIAARHARFFVELNAISKNEPLSPDIDEQMLAHFQGIVEGTGKEFATARLSNGVASIELDQGFETNLRRLLDEEDASYGSEEGMLEAVNIHGNHRKCWIYPRIGPRRIRCDFLPGTGDQIKENLGKRVRVAGVKYFRPNSPYAFRVSVRELDALAEENEPVHLKNLGGIAAPSGEQAGAVEFIRALRDEWD